jgi:hypothetical protein
MATLTREQSTEYIFDRLIADNRNVLFTPEQVHEFYKPQAEALYQIFTSTTPQARFPQHEVNMIRLNARFNPTVTRAFLARQYELWISGQWVLGLSRAIGDL